MDQTAKYLQSASDTKDIEIPQLVNCLLRDAVLQRMPTGTLQKVAIEQGMQTLWQRGLARALAGQTPLEEILRVVAVDQT